MELVAALQTVIFVKLVAALQMLKLIYLNILLSVIFVGTINFNNLCLQHVDISFDYIRRSLTTVFNVLLTYFILENKTSLAAIACCGVGGLCLGVDQEEATGSFSLSGTVYGILASLFVSLFSINTKKVLSGVFGSVEIGLVLSEKCLSPGEMFCSVEIT